MLLFQVQGQLSGAPVLSSRDAYFYSINSGEYTTASAALYARSLSSFETSKTSATTVGSVKTVEDLVSTLQASRKERVDRFRDLSIEWDDALCREILREFAPEGLVGGYAFQNAICPVLTSKEFGATLLQIFSREHGRGSNTIAQPTLYRRLLNSVEVALPEASARAFTSASTGISEPSFDAPAKGLAYSVHARTFLPELLGIALVRTMGLPPVFELASDSLSRMGADIAFILRRPKHDGEVRELVVKAIQSLCAYLDASPSEPIRSDECKERIWRAALDADADQAKWDNFVRSLVDSDGRRRQVARLFQKKAPFATGYHAKTNLSGANLDIMMAGAAKNPLPLVDALAASHYIKAGDPNASLFLSKICAFGGSMFGIFSESELGLISSWIEHLPTRAPEDNPVASLPKSGVQFSPDPDEPTGAAELTSFRSVYHKVVNVERYPEVRPVALKYVRTWLQASTRLSEPKGGKDPVLPPEDAMSVSDFRLRPYTDEFFDERMALQHRKQIATYRPNNGVLPFPREFLCDMIIQTAPMALLDGVWIQRILSAGRCNDISCRLFSLYSDELGNGLLEQHHPVLFRKLAVDIGVDFPGVETEAFGANLPESSFVLGLYWAAISLFPTRLFPEILGLNLAIESQGVGGSYRSAIDHLQAARLNAELAIIHNSVDNYTGAGHTGLAMDGIKAFMNQAFQNGGDALRQQMWKRVWSGYCSWSMREEMKRAAAQQTLTLKQASAAS